MDPYALIAQIPNAGQAFSDSFNKGMQQNALAGFALNPNDPNAQSAAARYDPGAVMQQRQGQQQAQQQLSQQQVQEWHHYAGQLAKWADTPEKWDQAIDYLLSHNHPDVSTQDLLALKGKFNPALRQSFMALGGVQDDKPAEDPGIIREYHTAIEQGLIDKSVSYPQYVAMRNPGMSSPVTIPYGAQVTPGQAGGAPTAPLRYNPTSGKWEPEGGAGGNVSGGFPQ